MSILGTKPIEQLTFDAAAAGEDALKRTSDRRHSVALGHRGHYRRRSVRPDGGRGSLNGLDRP